MRWRMLFGGVVYLTTIAASPMADTATADTGRPDLRDRPPVRVCADPDYAPFDFIDDQGRHRGIAADLLEEIGRLTGLRMQVVHSAGWTETLELARRGDCDVVAMLNETAGRAEYLNFTRPYVTFENAIVTHTPAYHHGLASLAGRTLALPEGYRLVELIAAEHPDIEIVLVENADAALRAVSSGAAYATLINHQRLIKEVQQLGLRNIHFAGEAQVPDHYRIGVRRDDPSLLAAIDGALARLAPADLSRIMERWYVVQVESTIDWRMVMTVAGIAAALLSFLLLHLYHRHRYYALLERRNSELAHLSGTDPLTQTANRRRLDVRLAEELERARRYRRPLAIVLFDLDGFKDVNDTWGHPAGDTILIEVAEITRQRQRLTDVLGRWGGEEFMVICSETDLEEAGVLAERVRAAVEGYTFTMGVRMTVSLGIAALEEGDTQETLLHRADAALYAAKAGGRNRVEVAVSTARVTA